MEARPRCDKSSELSRISFVHTLLSMTGKLTIQPFIDGEKDLVAFFNGEIYNYLEFGDYESDGQCILPLYETLGPDFIPLLDGEYTLAVFDFSKDLMIISTDIFRQSHCGLQSTMANSLWVLMSLLYIVMVLKTQSKSPQIQLDCIQFQLLNSLKSVPYGI